MCHQITMRPPFSVPSVAALKTNMFTQLRCEVFVLRRGLRTECEIFLVSITDYLYPLISPYIFLYTQYYLCRDLLIQTIYHGFNLALYQVCSLDVKVLRPGQEIGSIISEETLVISLRCTEITRVRESYFLSCHLVS